MFYNFTGFILIKLYILKLSRLCFNIMWTVFTEFISWIHWQKSAIKSYSNFRPFAQETRISQHRQQLTGERGSFDFNWCTIVIFRWIFQNII